MKEPVAHVHRAYLPWRLNDGLTECGRPAAEFAEVIAWDELARRAREYGQQRLAMVTCMTCLATAQNHSWSHTGAKYAHRPDLVEIMDRECSRARWDRDGSKSNLGRELAAIAALVEAHRDEFDDLLAGLGAVEDLATKRAAKRLNDVQARRAGRRPR